MAAANPLERARDDRLFTGLLSSAYSLQQQHDRIRSKLPATKFSEIIAEVIDTQSLIRKRKLDSETAMHLIANRTQKLSGAAGAAIALCVGEDIDYQVGTGVAVTLPGMKIRANESISFERLKWGQFVETDTWQDKALATRLVAKVLSAPIYRYGALAGCIQLFSRHGRFDSDGVYVCELMAGVVSHLIGVATGLDEYEPHISTSIPGNETGRILIEEKRPTQNALPSPTRLRWGPVPPVWKEPEPRVTNLAMSAGRADWQTAPSQEPGPRASWADSTNGSEPHAASSQNELEPLPDIDDLLRQLEDTDMYRQEAAQPGPEQGPLLGYSGVIPSNGNPAYQEPTADERRDTGYEMASFDSAEPSPAQDRQVESPGKAGHEVESQVARRETWRRIKPVIYPGFVLLFVIFVRINAGPHGWPLEIVIYILLVLTTLELRNRLSKP